jgi:hypothetical protein
MEERLFKEIRPLGQNASFIRFRACVRLFGTHMDQNGLLLRTNVMVWPRGNQRASRIGFFLILIADSSVYHRTTEHTRRILHYSDKHRIS